MSYRLKGLWRIFGDDDPPPSSLQALLGPQRATVLALLNSPMSIGAIADVLLAVPSAATHHVKALEAAGLVARKRRGRHVLVERTDRGTELLILYER